MAVLSLIDQDRATRDAMREIVALDQFHHERGDTATLFEPVHNGIARKLA